MLRKHEKLACPLQNNGLRSLLGEAWSAPNRQPGLPRLDCLSLHRFQHPHDVCFGSLQVSRASSSSSGKMLWRYSVQMSVCQCQAPSFQSQIWPPHVLLLLDVDGSRGFLSDLASCLAFVKSGSCTHSSRLNLESTT